MWELANYPGAAGEEEGEMAKLFVAGRIKNMANANIYKSKHKYTE
jgi:hypothetical protein